MISEFGNNISTDISKLLNEIHANHPSISTEKVSELKKLDKTLTVLSKLIAIFQNEKNQRIPEMKVCCNTSDYDTLSRIIHRFKSTTYNLGAARAVELCKHIEHAMNKELKSHLEISQLISLLDHECDMAYQTLLTYLPVNN